jgi:hypothetical protein
MPSKKNGSKNLFENMPVEPEHLPHENPESKDDKLPAQQNNQVEESAVPAADSKIDEQAKPEDGDTSTDGILEDVRRSLIEEEATHEQEAQQKWWKRIGRKSRRNSGSQETPKVVEEAILPHPDQQETVVDSKPEPELKEEADELDDLIDLLAAEQSTPEEQLVTPEPAPPAPEPEPENVVNIEELKKQAFEPRPSTVQEENLTEVRSIALEGQEEAFVEVEATRPDALEERLTAAENALKPYQRYIYTGLAVLGAVMAVIAGLVLYNLYRQTVAASVPTPIPSDVPYPTSVSLPGGWTFTLGKGALVAGSWDPKGAEWLQGTEVCRWVALPWTRQLEAVVRTLNPNDPIQLGMSNNDILTYKVYSIKQMSPAEMQQLDSNTPCLLIVLVQPDSDKRWVLTSLP